MPANHDVDQVRCPYCDSTVYNLTDSEHDEAQKLDDVKLMEEAMCGKCGKEYTIIYRLASIVYD